jgi:predicted esterase
MNMRRRLKRAAEHSSKRAGLILLTSCALGIGACGISPDVGTPDGSDAAGAFVSSSAAGSRATPTSSGASAIGGASTGTGAGSSYGNGSGGATSGSQSGFGNAGTGFGSGSSGNGFGFGSGFGGSGSGLGSGFGGGGFGLGSGFGGGGFGLGSAASGSGFGTGGTGTGGATPGSGGGNTPAQLPTPKGTCAPFSTGKMTFGGLSVTVWSAAASNTQPGPLMIYWHGTGTNGQEVQSALGQASVNEIVSQGGVVASFESSTAKGTNTGDLVWYTGDFEIADEIVACGIAQKRIDPRRIYTAGYSAGGLQSAWMAYARSSYLAAVITYSGGLSLLGSPAPQDPSHVPPALCAHGGAGKDSLILDFAQTSTALENDLRKRGALAIDCDDGSSHVDVLSRFKVGPSAWQFLKDHPFGVKPEPYTTALPAGFPSYCKLVP